MEQEKAFTLFWQLYDNNLSFKKLIEKYKLSNQIRFFGDEEWEKIKNQNFLPVSPDVKEFIDMFALGYNIGNCVGASMQLSYSYNDVDIVSGILPILKGTRNALKEGGHCWLETKTSIIDTSLMLVMDKKLKEEFGYIEEQRITAYALNTSERYQKRKEFALDPAFKR